MQKSPALLLCALLAAGCASTPLGSSRSAVDDEMRELKARVLELQRKAAVSEVELAQLRQQVAELQGRPGGRPAATRPATGTAAAPLPRAPEPPEVREIAPTIEESDLDAPPPVRPAPSRPAPTPPGGSGGTTPPRATPRPATPAPASATPPAPVPSVERSETPGGAPSPAAQALYDRGYTLYHQGHYVDAEASFQRFLQGQPAAELADNAQYWIGECRYARGDMRGALAAFRETVQRYPEGNKVPDALLKAGQALETLGDLEGARASYKEVARRFPGSAAAVVAEERRGKLP